MSDETHKQNLSQGQRRSLILVAYVGLCAYVGTSLLTENILWLLFGTAGFLALVVLHGFYLSPFTQKIADRRSSTLDERQRLVRNRAGHLSYRILGLAVLLLSTYLLLDATWFDGRLWSPRVSDADFLPLYLGATWLIFTLPTAIIAWNEAAPEDNGL